ncbi:LuxR C-terminal-related transcriptional regulator [Brevibacterium sp.]|uniref:helix-turn-helix transcriptional regulator n=1 Tax=Brevibacterium sp. TaxID=1701 RepID=UPI002811635A|nr:LuxR C-terminal-related transcriptional regulator [Brevibacterium sp.]
MRLSPVVPSGSPEALQQELNVGDREARLLYRASGGWLPLARAAQRSTVTSGKGLDELLTSTSLAEFAIADAGDIVIPLESRDRLILRTLSLLHGFSDRVAMTALEAVSEAFGEFASDIDDLRLALLRLRSSGMLLPSEGSDMLFVPPLISAWIRLRSGDDLTPSSEARRFVVEAFVEQVEFSKAPDPVLTENALTLARSGRLWSALSRIASAVGLPILYLHPRAALEAFAELPQKALREEPDLVLPSLVADRVAETCRPTGAQTAPLTVERVRELVARATAPGSPASRAFTQPTGADLSAFDSSDSPSTLSAETDADEIADGGETITAAGHSEARRVLAQMVQLSSRGRHREAASLGAAWTSSGPRRPRTMVRFAAAVEAVLAGEPGRALALLRDMEDTVAEMAVAGDFLPPAIAAWSALASYFSGDHKRADTELVRFTELDEPPLVLEAAFRPAALVTRAYRALDRLELGRLADLVARMKSFPEMGALWVHVPLLERSLALLGATSESGVLLADDEAESYSRSKQATDDGMEILRASRIAALVGLGQLYRAGQLIEDLSPRTGAKYVLMTRSCIVAGHPADALALVRTHFYHDFLSTRERAELTGLAAVAHLRLGDQERAVEEFRETIELVVWVGSMLPIALLPAPDRNVLLDLTADVWEPALQKLTGHRSTAVDLRRRLGRVATALVASAEVPSLTARERTLLDLLEQGLSVSQIAAHLHLVEGTVKNNLSALYRKLGATGRDSALARARTLGYMEPPEG